MDTPKYKNPCPAGHKIDIFCSPFLVHHYYILNLSELCLRVKRKIFKEILLSKITSPWGWVTWNLHFLSLALHWTSSSWEDVNARRTTHIARQRTPTHSNRSPEWLRWHKNYQKLTNWKYLRIIFSKIISSSFFYNW